VLKKTVTVLSEETRKTTGGRLVCRLYAYRSNNKGTSCTDTVLQATWQTDRQVRIRLALRERSLHGV